MKTAILFAAALNLAAQVRLNPVPKSTPVEAQAQTTGKSSIGGSVVDSLTGQLIRKATVLLSGRRLLLNAVTDTSGHFAFRLLPAGQYTIQAFNDSYPVPRNPLQIERTRFVITVGENEQKQDVSLKLVPSASVNGRVVDEEDNPMRGCFVMAMQSRATDSGPAPFSVQSAQTDDKGEYLMKIPGGKYYIMARCPQSLPLPHAFVLLTASDLPSLVYPSRFYPGVADLAAAAKIEAAPGANVGGINLRMTPATGFTIRGHASGLDAGGGTSQIMLEARGPSISNGQLPFQRSRGRINEQTGEFEIRNVVPGSYDLVASSSLQNRLYFARVPVEVGAIKPDPVNLELAEAPSVSGTVSSDSDTTRLTNVLWIRLNPLDPQQMRRPPRVEVQSDGSFRIPTVMPGHWQLFVDGATYLKSVTRGDQQISANDLEIGASAVSLKIVLGTKFGQIDVTASDPGSGVERVFGILWSAGDSRFQRNVSFDRQPQQLTNLPPGRYYGCGIATAQIGFLLNDYALRKALESHCPTVELAEGEHASLQMPLISSTELEQLIDKLEQ